jgi:hypothetical protein
MRIVPRSRRTPSSIDKARPRPCLFSSPKSGREKVIFQLALISFFLGHIQSRYGRQSSRRVLPVGTGHCLSHSRVALQPLGFDSLALLASLDWTKVVLTMHAVDLEYKLTDSVPYSQGPEQSSGLWLLQRSSRSEEANRPGKFQPRRACPERSRRGRHTIAQSLP